MEKSRILIIGATGKLGYHIAKASIYNSYPTYTLVRHSSFSDTLKRHKLNSLTDAGAIILKGSLEDETSLVEALKKVDVVICAIPSKNVLVQKNLINAIKIVGSIKKFIPSEFGLDPDKVQISDMDNGFYSRKAEIRRIVEAEGIPHTYICCNFFMSYLLPSLVQPGLKTPPRDKVTIFGDGTVKGVFVNEIDVAAFTISAVDDPRTLNKAVYLRPAGNVYSMNELVELWESKIGKQLDKHYVSEEQLLTRIKETPYPQNMELVFIYSAFIKGDQTYFDIESSGGVEGTQLYPHLKQKKDQSYLNTSGTNSEIVVGGTGYIGKFIVEASAKTGHPTFALIRESTLVSKAELVTKFKGLGVNIISGDLNDHEILLSAIKQVDVVISTVGSAFIGDQVKIIDAIKKAGNIKRFFPSEFGNDVDRTHAVEPAKTAFATKAEIRRAVEAQGIPYTYVSSNFFAGYFLPSLSQPGATSPPRDKVIILGDGNAKAVYAREEDIGTYTIRAVDDPRTLNKILYIRPPANTLSFNELVTLWEKKIGKTLEKVYVPEEQVLKNIQETEFPGNILLSITHSVYVKGDQTNFDIDSSFGVEATELYPDVKYTTVDEYLNQFV